MVIINELLQLGMWCLECRRIMYIPKTFVWISCYVKNYKHETE